MSASVSASARALDSKGETESSSVVKIELGMSRKMRKNANWRILKLVNEQHISHDCATFVVAMDAMDLAATHVNTTPASNVNHNIYYQTLAGKTENLLESVKVHHAKKKCASVSWSEIDVIAEQSVSELIECMYTAENSPNYRDCVHFFSKLAFDVSNHNVDIMHVISGLRHTDILPDVLDVLTLRNLGNV
jgi:hypothetical protein